VVHPLQLACFPLTGVPGGIVSKTERAKTLHDEASCKGVGWDYAPLVLSSWGSQGFQALDLTSQIIKDATKSLPKWEAAALAQHMRQTLSLSVMQGVVAQLAYTRLVEMPSTKLQSFNMPSLPKASPCTFPFVDEAGNEVGPKSANATEKSTNPAKIAVTPH
jgi:hypothetical protein